jgi:hypothetical protein
MVTGVGIIVAAIVTLVVNYQNRKQARQNELFRKDPTVGLIPPPHPWAAFLRKNWYHFVYLIGIIYFFCRWMVQDFWQHSYHAGVSAALFVLYLVTYLVSITFRMNGGITEVIDWVSEDTTKAIKVLSAHNKMLVAVICDLESQGLLSDDTKAQIKIATAEIRSVRE